MKFLLGSSVLIEIMACVQDGLSTGTDISQRLREIEVKEDPDKEGILMLADDYVCRVRGRD